MSLLDRYIARQFLINVVALFAILFCFVIAVDATLNIDRFLKRAAELSAAEGSEPGSLRKFALAGLLIADLWWPKLLLLFNFMLGIVLVGAMGFTCAQMVRHRELVAVLASGQSLRRVARPFFIVALGFTVLQAVNQEVFLPRIAPLLPRDHGDAGQRTLQEKSVLLVPDTQGRLFSAARFDADARRLDELLVWVRDDQDRFAARIHADAAVWRNGGWDLENGFIEPVDRSTSTPIARLETSLDPRTLTMAQYAGISQSLSFTQVGGMLRVLDRMGGDAEDLAQRRDRLERIRWGRFSVMAANLLGLCLAVPFFLTRVPMNMMLQSIKAAPVALGAVIGGIVGSAMPLPGVPAAIGVFAPVIVTLPMLLWASSRIRT
ncbi:MAG: LptF/LptG family permease [Phycisphaerales bacterium JB037]